MRDYQVGDIPNIQIDYKELLEPLMMIVAEDSPLAIEIMVELFQEIYKLCLDQEERLKMGRSVSQILENSKIFDYSTINCLQRIGIEMLKIDGFIIDPELILKTGEASMNF